jgi:hypothetical protein
MGPDDVVLTKIQGWFRRCWSKSSSTLSSTALQDNAVCVFRRVLLEFEGTAVRSYVHNIIAATVSPLLHAQEALMGHGVRPT